ncbi:MAG: hypothetical protein A4E30_00419 [Methanomassiliicoccales archaeon PtaB.Bin215]|nr:MAG: hypothetical protein A4E30_00419 [Methanomassiliicoccales archaeon PtaB.Bin215]
MAIIQVTGLQQGHVPAHYRDLVDHVVAGDLVQKVQLQIGQPERVFALLPLRDIPDHDAGHMTAVCGPENIGGRLPDQNDPVLPPKMKVALDHPGPPALLQCAFEEFVPDQDAVPSPGHQLLFAHSQHLAGRGIGHEYGAVGPGEEHGVKGVHEEGMELGLALLELTLHGLTVADVPADDHGPDHPPSIPQKAGVGVVPNVPIELLTAPGLPSHRFTCFEQSAYGLPDHLMILWVGKVQEALAPGRAWVQL